MASASEQHGQDSLCSSSHNEENPEHAEIGSTQLEIGSSDVAAPDGPNYALEGSSGPSTENLRTYSTPDGPSANHDLPIKEVDLSGSLDIERSGIDVAMMQRIKALATNRSSAIPVITGAGAIFKGSQQDRDKSYEELENTSDRRSFDAADTTEEVEINDVNDSTTSDYNDASRCVSLFTGTLITTLTQYIGSNKSRRATKPSTELEKSRRRMKSCSNTPKRKKRHD